MDNATLRAEIRTKTGKGSARRARREGKIPAILYSHFSEPTPIALDPKALRKAVRDSEHGFNTVLTLELGEAGKRTALLKDWQIDPVSRRLLHADFLEVKMDEAIEAEVPITLVGKAKGVEAGGILSQLRREITVRCRPGDIPGEIEVDISPLEIGDSLHVGDIPAPEGVEIRYTHNYTIAVVTPPEGGATPAGGAAEAAGEASESGAGEGGES
ncbi:MAG: 50S ribosomal protein L25/general stress protein Ctc [Deltaproteobacteria bacterium]|nr:MAG: 50S ribosomal protein L25/general stress protein Ctc [Deltaproteobacteria bacterium]